jgi:hypothetical protein
MDDTQREGLRQVLVAYFGGTPFDRALRELVDVTADDPAYHRQCRDALTTGVRAARAGDPDVLPIARELWPWLADLPAAAGQLEELIAAYDKAYAERAS